MKSNHNFFFNYYQNIESYYEEHSDVLSSLATKMSKDFNISHDILKDSIKRSLGEILEDGPKGFLQTNKVSIKYKVFYYLVMLLFFINIFLGDKIKNSKKFKIVFDGWNFKGYQNFYTPLLNELDNKDALLYVTNYHNLFKDINSNIVKVYSNKYLLDSNISKNILKTQALSLGFYCNLSKKLNINFVYIALKIFKNIALHTTTAKKINCYVFVSAADNSFDSLRYDIYKKNGIQNIALLQNGFRTGQWANDSIDLYTYCDYYFGFGAEQINIQKGMVCDNKIPVGSIKLDTILKKYDNRKKIFDITFLASVDEYDTSYIKVKTYNAILDNLCLFKKNHPDLNIFYSDLKKVKKKSLKNNFLMMNKMKSIGIAFSSNYIKNSYEAINSSEVVLFYKTTIGVEALAMNTKVLNINYDKDMLPFSRHDYSSVLTNPSYEQFESKLLFLLDSKKSDFDSEDKELSYNYMNNSNNSNMPKKILEILLSQNINQTTFSKS